MTSFSPTQGEVALVNQIFTKHDPQKLGVITGDVAVNIFKGANLSAATLCQIWQIADADGQGFFTRKGVSVAVRLFGWAQNGEVISGELVNKPGPLAIIDGYTSSPELCRAVTPLQSPRALPFTPSLTAQDKARFTQLFKCGSVNGLLSGEKARKVFDKSKLPAEKLSEIWELSDTQDRGSLDVADFIVAMYLIQASMTGQLLFLPTTLPPGLYEMASDQNLLGSTVASHPTGNTGPFGPSIPGSFFQNSSTPQFQMVWDVTPTEKAIADKHFDDLDEQKRGYIDCDVVVPFMLQSNLPKDSLASIWNLTDLNDDGHLTRDGFAVAFHVIQGKLAGKEIPAALPASLIPPSMRVATVPTPPFQQFPSDSLNDLLWEDSPGASRPQSTILQPQRTGFTHPSAISAPQTRGQRFFGLLDSDDDDGSDDDAVGAFTSINDHPAEIRNLRNQCQSTTAALKNTKTKRSNVEVTVRDQAAQLFSLQIQLSSAKATHEAESHLLATLRERFNNRSSEIQKVKEELIRAEGDLSATRVEKAEAESNLLHSKEELYELQRKMAETYSTIKVVKAEIEKAKEETKQKEGLLVVTKQHLAAREEERAKLQEEVAEAGKATREREVADIERSHPPMTAGKPQEQWAGDREEKSEVQDSNEGR